MSGFKNPHTPAGPSIRAAAEALIAQIEGQQQGERPERYIAIGEQFDHHGEAWPALDQLKAALAEPEVSRADLLEDGHWAVEGIELMKGGKPGLLPTHIRAIVNAAEAGLQAAGSFGLRWRADMRAIERWRKGDALATDTRALLTEALSELRNAKVFYSGSAYAVAEKLIAAIEEHLAEAQPGARELILPDHADLVVWLLGLFDRSVEGISIDEVERLAERIGRAGMWHASQGSAHGDSIVGGDVAELIRKLARIVIDADRRAFLAEQRAVPADLEELIRGELETAPFGQLDQAEARRLTASIAARIAPFSILGSEPAQASGIGREPEPVPGVYSAEQGREA